MTSQDVLSTFFNNLPLQIKILEKSSTIYWTNPTVFFVTKKCKVVLK